MNKYSGLRNLRASADTPILQPNGNSHVVRGFYSCLGNLRQAMQKRVCDE